MACLKVFHLVSKKVLTSNFSSQLSGKILYPKSSWSHCCQLRGNYTVFKLQNISSFCDPEYVSFRFETTTFQNHRTPLTQNNHIYTSKWHVQFLRTVCSPGQILSSPPHQILGCLIVFWHLFVVVDSWTAVLLLLSILTSISFNYIVDFVHFFFCHLWYMYP